MALTYTKAETLTLRGHPDFNEAWVQTLIGHDPSILGLGEVELLQKEVRLSSGRLDLLLFDRGENTRYEVELMLGATDESHIIRTLEYWDIERRRYPAYDHCAVIVAENITGRFINVLSLFAGTVPLIAIQLSAIRVGDQIVLNFVRVLDRVGLRRDEESEVAGTAVNRDYWNSLATMATVNLADQLLHLINQRAKGSLQLNFLKQYIGLTDGNRSRNFVYFVPQKQNTYFYANVPDSQSLARKFSDAGFEAGVDKNDGFFRAKLRPKEFDEAAELLKEVVAQAVQRYESQ